MKRILKMTIALFILPSVMMAGGGDKALNKAINAIDANGVRKALADGANPNARQYGKSALFNAVGLGHREVIKVLLEYKADAKEIEVSGGFDKRGILTYVGLSRQEYAKWWNDFYKKYARKDTIFDTAMFCSPYELAEMLCKAGADVNAPGIMEGTPMQIALSKNLTDVAKLYVDYGYVVDQRLFMLEDKYNKDRTRFETLAKEQKVKFDHSNAYPTALMIAIQRGNTALVKSLIDHKANVNAKKIYFENTSTFFEGGVGKGEITPLTMAKEQGNQEIIDMLIAAGAKE